jgi:RNA polymerase sigma-70 factor (ECF subfamily)
VDLQCTLINRFIKAGWEKKLHEKELVDKARKGDYSAFKELVQKYEHQVAATVIGMLGQTPETDDIGQETFIRFYRSLHRFRGDSSVGTYLTRIAINLSLNEIKRRNKHRHFTSSNSDIDIETFPDTSRKIEQKETRMIIQKAIQQLKPKFRTVVVLRLIDGYTTEETANILKLPLGTVLSRLARAQMKLKNILTPIYGMET